jgi:flavin reductase (DIM6/NTAB) family NADH-FMN oxidoreductase RutF
VPGQDFRDAMARLPAGVVVVSAKSRDAYRGMTASSLVSVSLEPPIVLVALERGSATLDAVKESNAFNASLLTRDQEFVADRLAGRAPAIDGRWSAVPHRIGHNGLPLIDGCAAWLECRLLAVHPAGDHEVCIGQVDVAELGSGDPLILWDRSFWTLHK